MVYIRPTRCRKTVYIALLRLLTPIYASRGPVRSFVLAPARKCASRSRYREQYVSRRALRVPIDVVIYLAHLLMSTANVLPSFAPHEFIDRHYPGRFFCSRSSTSGALFALRSHLILSRSGREIGKRIYNYISEKISRRYVSTDTIERIMAATAWRVLFSQVSQLSTERNLLEL